MLQFFLASSPDVFLKQILLQVDKPCQESHDSNVAIVTLKQCIKDLNQFSQVEPSLSGCVLFSSQLLQCRLSLMKVTVLKYIHAFRSVYNVYAGY